MRYGGASCPLPQTNTAGRTLASPARNAVMRIVSESLVASADGRIAAMARLRRSENHTIPHVMLSARKNAI
jgi:hypothetical protein